MTNIMQYIYTVRVCNIKIRYMKTISQDPPLLQLFTHPCFITSCPQYLNAERKLKLVEEKIHSQRWLFNSRINKTVLVKLAVQSTRQSSQGFRWNQVFFFFFGGGAEFSLPFCQRDQIIWYNIFPNQWINKDDCDTEQTRREVKVKEEQRTATLDETLPPCKMQGVTKTINHIESNLWGLKSGWRRWCSRVLVKIGDSWLHYYHPQAICEN